jgi:uncharacterized protein (DUF885 family)
MKTTISSFTALNEEFVELAFRHDPVAATNVGIHDYDHLLPDDSPEGFAARLAWLRDFEGRLNSSLALDELPTAQRVDFTLLRSWVEWLAADLEQIHDPARNPVRYPETALMGVFLLMARPFAPLEERKEAILERMMAIPDYLANARANLRQVPEVFVTIASEVTATGPAFVDEVVRVLLANFPAEAERIEHGGERARMGFLQYQAFLERDLRNRTGGTFAIGEDRMNFKLARQHMLAMDCVALEAFGREQMESTRALLDAEARRIDSSRSWREQVADARSRHPDPLRLRDAYQAEVERARQFTLEKRLAPIPEGRLEIIETPVFERPIIPFSTYLAPAPFDVEHVGYFYVTPIDPSRERDEQEQQLHGHCYAALPLIALHETYPGHHLQLLHACRAGSRPRRLAVSSLFSEGWALYCEELMQEQGFFLDPVTRLFQLRDLMWRACRVVIDAGLHSGRMSFEQAVDLLVEEAMLERVNAESEVKRYTLTPTQPMSYLVGKKLIIELRDEARRRMGPGFDLHGFHAALLASGSLPPALIGQEIWARIGAK